MEIKIRALGFSDSLTNKLLEKYKHGEISSNHVRDIGKINSIEEVSKLNQESQENLANKIIEKRNEQTDENSSEAAIILIKNGNTEKYIIDTWYRGILRLINNLHRFANVDESTVNQLSSAQKDNLSKKIKVLIERLEKLILLLS